MSMDDRAGDYAGDLSSVEAFERLKADPNAVLVDVRTVPEWQFVGVPDLSDIGKSPVFECWQSYPRMETHPDFAKALQDKGLSPDQTILLLCRSGARSRAAAIALAHGGFAHAYNVADGFEGPLDQQRHRGSASGWQAAGLPWIQQ